VTNTPPQTHVEIRVRGHVIPDQWTNWFGGLAIENHSDGTAQLSGQVADQSELHGILDRIRDLGLALVSVRATEPGDACASGVFEGTQVRR